MVKFSLQSIALKWYFVTFHGAALLYGEFFNLFMKQLGFNPDQIGYTTLLGLPHLFAPLFLLFGDRFRARKVVVVIVTFGAFVYSILPLFSLVIPSLHPVCKSKFYGSTSAKNVTSNNSLKAIHHRANFTNTDNLSYKQLNLSFLTSTNCINQSLISLPTLQQIKSPNITANNSLSRTYNSIGVLFIILTISRSVTFLLSRVGTVLVNIATMTYIRHQKAKYGFYRLWSMVASAVSISSVALVASCVRITICEVDEYGYFTAFIWTGIMLLLSTLSIPWFKFEYDDKKRFSWSGVKVEVLNGNYIFILMISLYTGLCVSFQASWEFWYLDSLSAGPLLIGGAALVRRPLVAVSTFTSAHLINKIGDLNTVCLALFLYSCSFLALSFTRTAWLVIVIDTCQATALGLHYCAFIVHFSKLASKENSCMIIGESTKTSSSFSSYLVGQIRIHMSSSWRKIMLESYDLDRLVFYKLSCFFF